jgi:phage I-like protein
MPRASLTNTPNLRGMAALNSQESDNMDLLASLIKLLGLPDGSDASAVVAKVKDACGGTAMQSIAKAAGLKDDADAPAIVTAVTTLKAGVSLASIAKAAGIKEDATIAEIAAAVTTLAAGSDAKSVVALQAELAEVTTRLNALTTTSANDKAIAFVDGEITRGRVGVKPLRDKYIAMHAANPAQTEELIKGLPILGAGGAILPQSPPVKDGTVSLNSEQFAAAKLLGVKPEDYQKTLASENAA